MKYVEIKIQDALRIMELVKCGTYPLDQLILNERFTAFREFEKEVIRIIQKGGSEEKIK